MLPKGDRLVIPGIWKIVSFALGADKMGDLMVRERFVVNRYKRLALFVSGVRAAKKRHFAVICKVSFSAHDG